MVLGEIDSLAKPGAKKPPAVGLFDSVVMVVALMRRNLVQAVAGRDFQLQPADCKPAMGSAAPGNRQGTRFVYPGSGAGAGTQGNRPGRRHGMPDVGLECRSGPVFRESWVRWNECADRGDLEWRCGRYRPGPGAWPRHDAYAFEASGLKAILGNSREMDDIAADLGYIGVNGIGIVPLKRVSGRDLEDWQREFNVDLSKIRSAVEHAVAKVKCWRMLSEEGGRYRCR